MGEVFTLYLQHRSWIQRAFSVAASMTSTAVDEIGQDLLLPNSAGCTPVTYVICHRKGRVFRHAQSGVSRHLCLAPAESQPLCESTVMTNIAAHICNICVVSCRLVLHPHSPGADIKPILTDADQFWWHLHLS
jgi:hypothetical protein